MGDLSKPLGRKIAQGLGYSSVEPVSCGCEERSVPDNTLAKLRIEVTLVVERRRALLDEIGRTEGRAGDDGNQALLRQSLYFIMRELLIKQQLLCCLKAAFTIDEENEFLHASKRQSSGMPLFVGLLEQAEGVLSEYREVVSEEMAEGTILTFLA